MKHGNWSIRTRLHGADAWMGLARQGAVRRREDIEIAMEESMMEIIPQLEKRTQYLALLSNIAPFSDCSAPLWVLSTRSRQLPCNPAQKASLLAASIRQP